MCPIRPLRSLWRRLLAFAAVGLAALPGQAGAQAVLVKDINTDTGQGHSRPSQVVELASGLLFFGARDFEGTWAFTSDGSVAGTQRVTDQVQVLSNSDVVAMGGAPARIVLLGDPQQLSQPSKGIHPEGAGVSALDHLLGDVATVPEDRGVFLGTSWRMHPDVCSFVSSSFYDGRLTSDPSCAVQSIDPGPWVSGTGLRWAPVVHQDNRVTSAEEVDEVVRGVHALLGRAFTPRPATSQVWTPSI